MTHSADFEKELDRLRTETVKGANRRLRDLFFNPATTDLAMGTTLLKMRKKGSQQLFILMQQWSPIMWLRSPDGFRFEIGEIDMRAMGTSALDPRIDEAVTDAVVDAMTDPQDNDFLGALIRDTIRNPAPTFYERESRG